MDLKQLRYFVTAVDAGSISAAARRLYMSQPPLSHQIKLLEEEIGCPLLLRGARNLRLTAAGRVLYNRAVTMLELEQTTMREVKESTETAGGTVRIGIVSSVVGSLVPAWLSSFSRLHPTVRFSLTEANTYQLLEKLRTGRIQAAVVRTPCSLEGLESVVMAEEPMVAVGLPSVLPTGEDLPPTLLADYPLLVYRRWEEPLRQQMESAGLALSPFCVSDDARTTLCLAEQGLGVGIVPKSAVGERRDMVCRELSPRLPSMILLVYRPDDDLPACTVYFLEYLREIAK